MKPTALITGASSGIGREFARLLAARRYNLVLVARRLDKLSELKKEFERQSGITVHIIPADLSIPNISNDIYQDLKKHGIFVDVLINNAGLGNLGEFVQTDWQREQQMLQVNILALTQLTKLFSKPMMERRSGKILNVASTAAFQPGPLMAVYYASKAYVLSFSRAIANELKPYGITVTALCPGPTQSEFQTAASMQESRLFNNRKPSTSADVASFGLKAMEQGKVVAVHGMKNRLLAFMVRFVPADITVKSVRYLNDHRS